MAVAVKFPESPRPGQIYRTGDGQIFIYGDDPRDTMFCKWNCIAQAGKTISVTQPEEGTTAIFTEGEWHLSPPMGPAEKNVILQALERRWKGAFGQKPAFGWVLDELLEMGALLSRSNGTVVFSFPGNPHVGQQHRIEKRYEWTGSYWSDVTKAGREAREADVRLSQEQRAEHRRHILQVLENGWAKRNPHAYLPTGEFNWALEELTRRGWLKYVPGEGDRKLDKARRDLEHASVAPTFREELEEKEVETWEAILRRDAKQPIVALPTVRNEPEDDARARVRFEHVRHIINQALVAAPEIALKDLSKCVDVVVTQLDEQYAQRPVDAETEKDA